jgi:hypothetical protein
MVELYDSETGKLLGEISDQDFEVMMSRLEEESAADEDYYVDPDTIELLKDSGLSASAASMMEAAVQGREGLEIRHKRK